MSISFKPFRPDSLVIVALAMIVTTWAAIGEISPANAATTTPNEEFSGRIRFPYVKWISLEDLHTKRADVELVDVRSNYEYNTLHIKDARLIPLSSATFVDEVKKLREASSKPIVFYCNGHTCMKSYEATSAAMNAGVQNVFAFDAGVFSWVKAYPDEGVLLGHTPADLSKIIGKEQLALHTLAPAEFESRVATGGIVLDVRDQFQRDDTLLFPMVQKTVPLDNAAIKRYIEQARSENRTLLIYDAAGHQVRWLQYYLEAEKVRNYYFMAGGARGYFDYLIANMKGAAK